MYWGSVKFFKHLILLVFFGLIAAAIVLAMFWGVRCVSLENERRILRQDVKTLQTHNTAFEDALNQLRAGDTSGFLALCWENGIDEQDAQEVLSDAEAVTQPAFQEQPVAGAQGAAGTDFPYQSAHPELRVSAPASAEYVKDCVYLTFDNGPSPNTGRVLDILDKYQVKATFFVTPAADGSDDAILKRINDAGHTVGVRPSVDYKATYASVEGFLDQFAAVSERIEQATGRKPDIFRFPGGSINSYNRLLSDSLISEMLRRGYTYFDWNIDSGETANGLADASQIAGHTVSAVGGLDRAVVLLYDGWEHTDTPSALDKLIPALKTRGYTFDRLANTVKPVTFVYPLS